MKWATNALNEGKQSEAPQFDLMGRQLAEPFSPGERLGDMMLPASASARPRLIL